MYQNVSYENMLAQWKDELVVLGEELVRAPDWRALSPDELEVSFATYLGAALLAADLFSEVYQEYFSEVEVAEDEMFVVLDELIANELITESLADEFMEGYGAAAVFLSDGELGGKALYYEYLGKVPQFYATMKVVAQVIESLPKGLDSISGSNPEKKMIDDE